MKHEKAEFQNFINKVTEIKKENYDEFIRIKYLVDGVLLAKKTSIENSKKEACGN